MKFTYALINNFVYFFHEIRFENALIIKHKIAFEKMKNWEGEEKEGLHLPVRVKGRGIRRPFSRKKGLRSTEKDADSATLLLCHFQESLSFLLLLNRFSLLFPRLKKQFLFFLKKRKP